MPTAAKATVASRRFFIELSNPMCFVDVEASLPA